VVFVSVETTQPNSQSGRMPATGRTAYLWMLGILCVVYLPVFLGRITFFRDVSHWIVPARAFLHQSLRAGELPLWNPYQGLGMPVPADPLYGVFYPPNWLFALVPATWIASLATWFQLAHLMWGATAIFWLARRLKLGAWPAAVAGLAWALSGYITSQWSVGIMVIAHSWVPWAAVGQVALLDDVRAGRWRTGVVKAALPTALAMLAGEIFIALIGAGFGLVVAIVVQAYETQNVRRLRWGASAALSLLLALGVGAITVLPARAAMSSTDRAGPLPREIAEVCSVHPARFIEFAAPRCMGDPHGDYPARAIVGEPTLDGLPLSYGLYMGAAVLGLVLAGLQRRAFRVLAGLTIFALAIALGRHLPVHDLFRRIVVPVSYMRYPEKYLVLVVTGVALLAGAGTDRLLSGAAQPWRRTGLFLGALLALAIAAPFLLPFPWSGYMSVGARNGALAVLGLLGAQILIGRRSRLATPVLVAVVACDLAAAVWPLQGFASPSLANQIPAAAHVMLGAGQSAPPRLYRAEAVTASVAKWVPAHNQAEGEARLTATLITNTANMWGIATMPGYDAAIPSRLTQTWAGLHGQRRDSLRLYGVDYTVQPTAGPQDTNQRMGLQAVLDPQPGARLYRVNDVLPRVYLAGHAQVMDDAEAQRRLVEPDVVAGNSVWLAPSPQAQNLSATPGRAGRCEIQSFGLRRVHVRCFADRPAVAVLIEQFDRGWQARVDGRDVPVLRANINLRAVTVDAGTHDIEFTYHAAGLATGGLVSGLSLLGLVALALFRRRETGRGETYPDAELT
jgi:hypothetical protein